MTTQEKVVQIFEEYDFYVPRFDVKVGKQKLSLNIVRDIIEVSYKDNIQEMDSFDLTIFNQWEHGQQRASGGQSKEKEQMGWFKYSDETTFDPGQIVELSMGYMGKKANGTDRTKLMITGEITSLKPSFPASGQSVLSISGVNTLHRLTRKKQESHTYENLTDSQIAKQVAQRLGMDLHDEKNLIQKEPKNKYVFQNNQFDIVFLMERAHRIGYEMFVEEAEPPKRPKPVLHFHPSDKVKQVTYELHYGNSLMQFQPTLTTANQVEKVTVKGWDAKNKKPITASATRASIQNKGLGTKGRQSDIDKAVKGYEEVITDKPVHTQPEAQYLADETLKKITKDLIKASGSTMGLPELRAGTTVLLTGLGQRFSGHYFVTATTHTINDSGYMTQFECRREEN